MAVCDDDRQQHRTERQLHRRPTVDARSEWLQASHRHLGQWHHHDSCNLSAALERDRVQRFVVIASNSTSVTAQNMTDGLDWMIQQTACPGPTKASSTRTCLV